MAEHSKRMRDLGMTVVEVASIQLIGHLPAWFGPCFLHDKVQRLAARNVWSVSISPEEAVSIRQVRPHLFSILL